MLKLLLQGIAALFVFMVVLSSCSDDSDRKVSSIESTSAQEESVQSPPEPILQPQPVDPWTYTEDQDPMGRGKIKHAITQSVNTVSFGFPYQGAQRGTLNLRRHPEYGRDVILSVERGQFLCSPIDGCSVLVRFGEGKPQRFSAVGPEDQSSTVLFIRGHDKFVSQAKKVGKLAIQAQFYQEGNQVFEFDISGLKW